MQAKKVVCVGLIFAGLLLLAGCDGNSVPKTEKETPSNVPVNQQESVKANTNAPGATKESAAKTMIIVTYAADKEGLALIPESHTVPFNDDPAKTAVSLLIAGTKNSELISVVPPGTEVLAITISDHVAFINFNDKLKNVSGSTGETLLVGAIVNTLTEFPEIHKVQILINDKKVPTLSGHLELSEPFERMERIIKK